MACRGGHVQCYHIFQALPVSFSLSLRSAPTPSARMQTGVKFCPSRHESTSLYRRASGTSQPLMDVNGLTYADYRETKSLDNRLGFSFRAKRVVGRVRKSVSDHAVGCQRLAHHIIR